jgi:hypothetical protein
MLHALYVQFSQMVETWSIKQTGILGDIFDDADNNIAILTINMIIIIKTIIIIIIIIIIINHLK